MTDTLSLSSLLDDLNAHSADKERMTLESLTDHFKERGFGFFLFLFALPAALPVPAIGLNTIIAIPLLLLTAQQAIGRQSLWIPKRFKDKSISRDTIKQFTSASVPFLKKIEVIVRPRLTVLSSAAMERVIGVVGFIMALAVTIPLPLTNTVPSFGIAMMAIGVLTRDGLAIIAGALIGLAWVVMLVSVVTIFGPEGIDLAKDFIKGLF